MPTQVATAAVDTVASQVSRDMANDVVCSGCDVPGNHMPGSQGGSASPVDQSAATGTTSGTTAAEVSRSTPPRAIALRASGGAV